MATKSEIRAVLDDAGVAYHPKAVKAELEVLLESVQFRQEMGALMGADVPEADGQPKAGEEVPEETPAPISPKPKGPELVKVVADKGVTMDGEHFYPDGVRVRFTQGVAWVEKGVAAVLASRVPGAVTITDETRTA